jgi:signal transduction histidine kinase
MAALLAFGAGGYWLRHALYTNRLDLSIARAREDAEAVAGQIPGSAGMQSALVLNDGRIIEATDDMARYLQKAGLRLPPDPAMDHGSTGTLTVRLGTPSDGTHNRLDGREVTLVSSTFAVSGDSLPWPDEQGDMQLVTAYVLVSPLEADAAVAAVDPFLAVAWPLAALFVAVVAWATTGRALRPVEAIRLELAHITSHSLDRRVPVPATGDEISRLATTTNATLDRLAAAIEREKRFVADAAHELRSPLAALRNTLEVGLAHPEAADPAVAGGSAVASTIRLQSLADDLLLLARLDREDQAQTDRRVDIAAVAEELIAERGLAAQDGPMYSLRGHRPALVRGEEIQLARALGNLLDNAGRYARSTVEVAVVLVVVLEPDGSANGGGESGGQWVVSVRDDGPGIPAERQAQVFERFARLDESRARGDGGAGLGLAIAREIAVRHRGSLEVDDCDGPGALLVLRLPADGDLASTGVGIRPAAGSLQGQHSVRA